MSAQVDVLAVIGQAAAALKYAGAKHDGVQQVLEARAAVAALIAERDALREEVAALRQQPAPAIIDNAGKVEVLARGWFHRLPDGDYVFNDEAWRAGKDCDGCTPCLIVASAAPRQPAPVVDDARMARALEWLRTNAAFEFPHIREHIPAIEEAIAAYNPNCGARTVRAQGVQS